MPQRVAVIDIGTNSARLEVAELRRDGSLVIIGDDKVSIRLGDSVFRDGSLSSEAFERGVNAVTLLIQRAGGFNVDRIRAVSTSAMREADNGRNFAATVEERTGVHVEIISGAEEARLIHLGACEDFPGHDSVLVLDIGGGSTEVAVGRGAGLWLHSYRLGSARMTEYFLHSDPPRAGELRTLDTYLENAFASRWTDVPESSVWLGTAGTNGAIADVLKREGRPYDLASVADLYGRMAKAGFDERRKMLGPREANRVDIILGGLAIAHAFLKVSGVPELRFSGRGLRDGLLVEEALRSGYRPQELGDARSLRRNKLLQLGQLYQFDRAHAEHVADLAVRLFDDLAALHQLTSEDRDILEAAALLHDIGHHISYSKHHKHTYYLIKNSDLAGFDEVEVEMIANVARYHRKAHPSEKHAPFREFGKEHRRRVQMLAGILRMADACDRRRGQVVRQVAARLSGGCVELELQVEGEADVERWLLEERGTQLFEQVFGKTVAVVEKPATS